MADQEPPSGQEEEIKEEKRDAPTEVREMTEAMEQGEEI
jgi:hypothetical protein